AAALPAAPPRRIVDYGCGAGHLTALLYRRFPSARIFGCDASALLLARAHRRLAPLGPDAASRVELVRTVLPSSKLARAKADLAVVAFPNFLPAAPARDLAAFERRLAAGELSVARALARPAAGDSRTESAHARYARLVY